MVSFLCNVGAPCWGAYWDSTWPVSSNLSSLPLRPFSSTPWTPSQQFFGLLLADMNYPLILPRKSACLAVPSPVSVFLLLSSLHRHHPGRNDSQEQRKKKWGRKGEREENHLERKFCMLYFISSQVPVHKDAYVCVCVCYTWYMWCVCMCDFFSWGDKRIEQVDPQPLFKL